MKKIYACENCDKKYSRYNKLKNHKLYKHPVDKTNDITNSMNNINNANNMNNANNTTNNTNNTNHITNNVTNNVINYVLPFGKENRDYISDDIMEYCINNPENGILKLINLVNFNHEHPENHNIKQPNCNKNEYHIFNGISSNIRTKDDLIRLLINENTWRIEYYAEKNNLEEEKLRELNIYLNYLENKVNDVSKNKKYMVISSTNIRLAEQMLLFKQNLSKNKNYYNYNNPQNIVATI